MTSQITPESGHDHDEINKDKDKDKDKDNKHTKDIIASSNLVGLPMTSPSPKTNVFVSCCNIEVPVILSSKDSYFKTIDNINRALTEKYYQIDKPCALHTRLYELILYHTLGKTKEEPAECTLILWKLSPANDYYLVMKTKTEHLFIEKNTDWVDFVNKYLVNSSGITLSLEKRERTYKELIKEIEVLRELRYNMAKEDRKIVSYVYKPLATVLVHAGDEGGVFAAVVVEDRGDEICLKCNDGDDLVVSKTHIVAVLMGDYKTHDKEEIGTLSNRVLSFQSHVTFP